MYPSNTDDAPQHNQLSNLSIIANFIESHGYELEGLGTSLSFAENAGGRNVVDKLLAPFKTNTKVDDHWAVEQPLLEKAINQYLQGTHKISIMPPKQYKEHGNTDTLEIEASFMRSLKSLLTNAALTNEQRINVDKVFSEVCQNPKKNEGGIQR